MIILGLTGSIGMGKSTVAGMFQYLGFPVQDADKVVHELMGPDGDALSQIKESFPDVVGEEGVDRKKLGTLVFNKPDQLKLLESILHPLVDKKRQLFLDQSRRKKVAIAVLDIPLLFEKGLQKSCDVSIVVRAPDFIQKQRVLKRDGMTEEKLKAIRKQQMPMHEKIKKADFIIQTGLGKGQTMTEVKKMVSFLCDSKAYDTWKKAQ